MGVFDLIPIRQFLVLLAVSFSLRLFSGCATEGVRAPASAPQAAIDVVTDLFACAPPPTAVVTTEEVNACADHVLSAKVDEVTRLKIHNWLFTLKQAPQIVDCPVDGKPMPHREVCFEVLKADGSRFLSGALLSVDNGQLKISSLEFL